MKPVIFDVYNIFIQLLYLKKVYKIESPDNKFKNDSDISIRHNLNELKHLVFTTSRRVETGYQIATTPWRNVKNEKLLVIGCRNIVELKQATFFGFDYKNIDGIDLFSTHKKIMTANMENMDTIPKETYDVVTLINTLAYSSKPLLVFSEIHRILKKNGLLIFNFAFHLKQVNIKSKFSNETFPDVSFISEKYLNDLFKKLNFEIYFKHSIQNKHLLDGNIIKPTWYGLKK